MKVFIIESELFVRRALEEALKKKAHEVLSFDSEKECLHFFRDFSPNILILDKASVEATFLDALKEFQEVCRFASVGMHFPSKGISFTEQEQELLDSVIEKPFEINKIAKELEEVWMAHGSR